MIVGHLAKLSLRSKAKLRVGLIATRLAILTEHINGIIEIGAGEIFVEIKTLLVPGSRR